MVRTCSFSEKIDVLAPFFLFNTLMNINNSQQWFHWPKPQERKEMKMAKCPKCGKDVEKPLKEWDVNPRLHVKLYECCGKKFRQYVKK